MLEDRRMRKLMDYERMDLVFPGVDFEGGVCFFLWDRDNEGPCEVTTISAATKQLDQSNATSAEQDVLVRDIRALKILQKVLQRCRAVHY